LGDMSRDELVGFVRRQRYGVVSTCAGDGRPQPAVVGIAVGEDGRIVFDTVVSSHKAQNLRRDPRVALVVWEGERTVQIEGVAREPTGAELVGARAIYFGVFPDGVERLRWPGITYFVIEPRWGRDSDFAVPRVEEVDL